MKRYKHPMNYNHLEEPKEVNTLPSLTVPDQTLSIREILNRSQRGLPIGGTEISYDFEDGDDSFQDDALGLPLASLDITERQDYVQSQKDKLSDIERKEKAKKAQKKNTEGPSGPEGGPAGGNPDDLPNPEK